MTPITMPQIGENLQTGVVVEWLKRENDAIEKGEVVLTVESEKAVFEVVAEAGGLLLEILHQEGEEVEVFAALAYIGQPGESIAQEDSPAAEDLSPAPEPASEKYPTSTAAAPESESEPEPPRRTRPFASPAARRLAPAAASSSSYPSPGPAAQPRTGARIGATGNGPPACLRP